MRVGIIPLRKGSKGIPGKNSKTLLGRPLFAWSLIEAQKSLLDQIYVYTKVFKYRDISHYEKLKKDKKIF